MSRLFFRFCTWALVFLLIAPMSIAQETVYKWVDHDGVVHFSDEPPDASEALSVEMITTAAAPTPTPAPMRPEPAIPTRKSAQPEVVPIEPAPVAATPDVDITTMSLEALDRRCEEARERKIAPLRAAEIAKCKDEGDKDPAWCERFYADYGAGGRNVNDTYRPPMFHDLPECLDALEERRRRFR